MYKNNDGNFIVPYEMEGYGLAFFAKNLIFLPFFAKKINLQKKTLLGNKFQKILNFF